MATARSETGNLLWHAITTVSHGITLYKEEIKLPRHSKRTQKVLQFTPCPPTAQPAPCHHRSTPIHLHFA